MDKIAIIGSPGAGKSTLAQQLSKSLNIEIIHLDRLFWQSDWREKPRDARDKAADVADQRLHLVHGQSGTLASDRLPRSNGMMNRGDSSSDDNTQKGTKQAPGFFCEPQASPGWHPETCLCLFTCVLRCSRLWQVEMCRERSVLVEQCVKVQVCPSELSSPITHTALVCLLKAMRVHGFLGMEQKG